MRRIGGFAVITEPEKPIVEFDTACCCHCGSHIRVKPGTLSTVYLIFNPTIWQWQEEPGASCYHCMKPVCLLCYEKGTCTPLERTLEQAERGQMRIMN